MVSKCIAIIAICASVCIFTEAWDWHYRQLRRLHEGVDPCAELATTNVTERVRFAKTSCYNFFLHFEYIPAAARARCPAAQDARCRLLENTWKCSLLIDPKGVNDTEFMDTVTLKWCIENFDDWDKLVEGEPETTTAKS